MAAKELADVIYNEFTGRTQPRDSLVYDVFPDMEVRIPGVYESTHEELAGPIGVMPWREFWARLQSVVKRLKDYVIDANYVPDVVLGISNGGLVVADLLGRELFQKTPILSLWANRSKPLEMFQSPVNNALLSAIEASNPRSLEVLLVDDIVASGQTISKAQEYLEQQLGRKATIRFLALFSRNQQYREIIRGFLLYEDDRIKIPESDISTLMSTERRTLPYAKDIRSS